MGFFRGKRKYTGFDRLVGKRAGVEKFKDWVLFLNGGKITCLGTYMPRDKRGTIGVPSVHGTGRAIDFGYKNREDCLNLIAFLERNWEAFGVEYIADYNYKPFGRGWRVDRLGWTDYRKGAIHGGGASWANWIHVELSNEVADDPEYIDAVFGCLLKPVS